jgi:hypothetical protein
VAAVADDAVGVSTDHSGRAHTASVRTYPSAAASSVLHRPSGDNMPAAARIPVTCGARIIAAPAATAPAVVEPPPPPPPPRLEPPVTTPRAKCAATSDDEHAVSITTLAPFKPKV